MTPCGSTLNRLVEHKVIFGTGCVGIALIATIVASLALAIILNNPSSLQWAKCLGNMTYYGVAGCYSGALLLFVASIIVLCARKKIERLQLGSTPFHEITRNNMTKESATKKIRLLLDNGHDINHKEDNEPSPSQLAIMQGNKPVLEALLENGATLPGVPVHWLAYATNLDLSEMNEFINFLLLKSSNEQLNEENFLGETALHWAMRHGNIHLVNALLKKGAKVKNDNDGNTLLHTLTEARDDLTVAMAIDLIKLISPQYIAIDAINKAGYSPIEWAFVNGHFNVCKALLSQGAKLPENAFHLLCGIYDLEQSLAESFFQFLVDQGMSIDSRFNDVTPLLCAASNENLAQIKVLCKMKADANVCNSHGNNALHYAIASFHDTNWIIKASRPTEFSTERVVQIIKVLRGAGTDVNKLNGDRKKPADLSQNETIRQALS